MSVRTEAVAAMEPWTKLPTVTSCRPTRPAIGARTCEIEIELACSTPARAAATAAFASAKSPVLLSYSSRWPPRADQLFDPIVFLDETVGPSRGLQ